MSTNDESTTILETLEEYEVEDDDTLDSYTGRTFDYETGKNKPLVVAGKGKKNGRPTVFTSEVISKIEEIAALDGRVKEIAHFAGVGQSNLYAYIADNPAFKERLESLKQAPVLKARRTVINSLENVSSAQWYLERKARNEYGSKPESDNTVINNVFINAIQDDVKAFETKLIEQLYGNKDSYREIDEENEAQN